MVVKRLAVQEVYLEFFPPALEGDDAETGEGGLLFRDELREGEGGLLPVLLGSAGEEGSVAFFSAEVVVGSFSIEPCFCCGTSDSFVT